MVGTAHQAQSTKHTSCSVALETHQPLKEDQYTVFDFCVFFRCVRLHLKLKLFEHITLCYVYVPLLINPVF